MAINPHRVAHTDAEVTFQDGNFAVASALVGNEYSGIRNESAPCRCGGTLWYKATIGAWKCVDCGDLAKVYAPDDIDYI